VTRWRGRWLLGVSVVHTAFALVVFRAPLIAMARAGLFDTVGEDPMLAAVAWFVLFGGALVVAALAIDQLESQGAPLRSIGIATLAMTVLGIVWMPASGFWLAIPAAISMIRRG
jgi:cytochrome c oxidase assembly factor CtaG